MSTGYVKLETKTFVDGVDLSLEFRTQLADGLLLFAFTGTGTYFFLQLQDGSLAGRLSVAGRQYPFVLDGDSVSVCDGQWHVVRLTTRNGTQWHVTVDSTGTVRAPPRRADVVLSSYLYVGGIPDDDSEVIAFIRRNQLEHIQHSQSWLFIAG